MVSGPQSPAGTGALDKGMELLALVIRDGGRTPAATLAAQLGLPGSTARRVLGALARQGLIARVEKGRYAAGGQFADLARTIDPDATLARIARPLLRRLAVANGATAHLGIFDDFMVTYLVKESPKPSGLFTREHGQLEAYCTGVGKILLAHLPPEELSVFLEGSFVRLTPRTITEPDALRAEVERAAARGYAVDDGEMADEIFCVAVPILDRRRRAVAAISLSSTPARMGWPRVEAVAADLTACAGHIAARAGLV
ncbi:IclR family transcriptional regulator [Sphingomonas colocasiae]|uniref:IclR family transcriptional regulator n=1 Tax=Sphingomonas colocasiae TaxID=1848973 RepID=A0ABS7PRQ8_9SPHN|nr:IclR family transcriptional regulator [Sphingomonas colocasiae]MBY8823908.1 IclR family transcriptional regulator [Sphingomonas colocasiae]